MPDESTVEPRSHAPARRRRRWWPRWLKLRYVLAGLILLGYAGWRYGWPATEPCQPIVCPLEEIGWLEAARLEPQCVADPTVGASSRYVYLAHGSLDPTGKPVFELQQPGIDQKTIAARNEIVPTLKLPNLAGRRFLAGVVWVDLPAEYEDDSGEGRDPALGHAVLLTCDESRTWEEAAELIVDLNRDRDLTDDRVMKLSDAWSRDDENSDRGYKWHIRVFDPVALARTADAAPADAALPATVEALPLLRVTYRDDVLEQDRSSLAFCPTSYRRGRIETNGVVGTFLVGPDGTRFGRYDGPGPRLWTIEGNPPVGSLAVWNCDRGTFWGSTVDAEGRELRGGPYIGPTGTVRVESAGGEQLRVWRFKLLRRGAKPGWTCGDGWIPVPRFPRFRLPVARQSLPVGDYGIERLELARGVNCGIVIEAPFHSTPKRAFSIRPGETAVWRLPKRLKLETYAVIEDRSRPHTIDWAWSTVRDAKQNADGVWKGPRLGTEVQIGASLSDPATGDRYAFYYRGDPPPESLALVIQDASGRIVHRGTMKYG